MKIGFVTCVALGYSCLEEIYNCGYEVDLLITLKDDIGKKKSGRIYLDDFSRKYETELLKIKNVNDFEVIEKIKDRKIDWLFIIGWSQIAKKEILETPKYGVIGMHPTLLPKGRGRASIPWAIIKGLEKTGVTAFKLDEGVDTGPIIDQMEIEISSNEKASTLYKKVNDTHIDLMASVLKKINDKNLSLIIQNDDEATEWPGRKPLDGELSLDMKVKDVDRLVRATTYPYPGAFICEKRVKKIIWLGRILEENDINDNKNVLKFCDGWFEPLDFETIAL